MPRKTKIAPMTLAPKKKVLNKTAFVLAQPKTLSAGEVVAVAAKAGVKLSVAHVYTIRSAARKGTGSAAKAPAAKAPAAKAPAAKTRMAKTRVAKVVAAKAPAAKAPAAKAPAAKAPAAKAPAAKAPAAKPKTPKASRPAKRAPKKAPVQAVKAKVAGLPKGSAAGIAELPPLDLAYAVGRLVAQGTTTTGEVLQLAAERATLIMSLQAELAALKGGNVPASEPVKAVKAVKKTRSAKAVKTVAKAVKTVAKAVKKTAAGNVITRSDGRTFTMTPKALAARKVQGQYLGYLRQVPAGEKARFKQVAKDKGVAGAVDALRKRLGKK